MKVLHFTQSYPPYNPGETAAFDDEEADKILKEGVAKAVAWPPEDKAMAEPPADKAVKSPDKSKRTRSRKSKKKEA